MSWLNIISAAAKATQDIASHLQHTEPIRFDANSGAGVLQHCVTEGIALSSILIPFVETAMGKAAADAEPESPVSRGQEATWVVIEAIVKALQNMEDKVAFEHFLRGLDIRQGTDISVQLQSVLSAVCGECLDVLGDAQRTVEHKQRIRGYIAIFLRALQQMSRHRDLKSLFTNEELQAASDRLVTLTNMDPLTSQAVSETSLIQERAMDGPHAHLNELLTLWEDRGPHAHIAWHLTRILDSTDARHAALRLPSEKVQTFLDAVQHVLNCGSLPRPVYNNMARTLLQKICAAHDQLPKSLFVHDIHDKESDPTFHGGFADIYRAAYRGRPVAFKRIRKFSDQLEKQIRSKLCREAFLWQGLSHDFILPFHGIDHKSFPSSFCLISPWMKNGTITSYLAFHGKADIHRLTLQIAKGLDYLHSMNVVHGDLKGANILITDDGKACLSDFGLATMIEEGDPQITKITSSSNHAGSVRWWAPELIKPKEFGCERFVRTRETDVYAFACVCIE
ncbi:kinase-like domain-containing protein, partial [Favolaschia claudopus]